MQLVTIMRFLTYRNYSKDYDGVMRLSNDDLQLIRNGYPTPEHYTEQNSLLFRFKELASEYRTYHFTGWATGQTLAQRFEYWKTARWIIAHHPLTGVGTGDVPNAYKDAYNATNSTLSDEWRLRAHNQYLSFGVAFGWSGMIYFIFVLAYALVTGIRKNDIVYLSFLRIAIASFFTEDTLDLRYMRNLLLDMTDKLAFELRNDKKLTSCIAVKIRYADFNTYTKQRQIPYTANDNVLTRHVLDLFDQLFERRQLIRLIGVKFSGLVSGSYQIDLFEDTIEQIELLKQMDHIRKRFGSGAVMRASGL